MNQNGEKMFDEYGKCEAHFWGVCHATDVHGVERRFVCKNCPLRMEVIEELVDEEVDIKLTNIHGFLDTIFLKPLGYSPEIQMDKDGGLFVKVDELFYPLYGDLDDIEDNYIFPDSPVTPLYELFELPEDKKEQVYYKVLELA